MQIESASCIARGNSPRPRQLRRFSATPKLLAKIFGESFIRTAEDSRCIIQEMPKFAEARLETRRTDVYSTCARAPGQIHTYTRVSLTEDANDRINGQCGAADKRTRYQGNNGESQDQSWLNATSASWKGRIMTLWRFAPCTLDTDYALALIACII